MPFWIPLGIAALLVLAIYLIRPTAQALPVASTVLWRRLLAARKRRRDRLRWLLSLLLATAVAGLLSVAASRAPWLQPGGGDPIALAFDPSPTMQARLPDGGPSRIELAAAEARRIVAAAEAGSRFTVNADPTPLTSAEVLALLSGPLETLSNAADTEPAIPTARRVHVFTDGIGPFTPIIDPGTEKHTVSVLVPARNAGIVRFATRPPATRATGPEALLEILATDPAGGQVPVELTVADSETIRIRRQLEIEPGERFTALIDLGSFAPGAVTARIETPGDVFPLDDRAGLIDAHAANTRTAAFSPAHRGRGPADPWRVVVIARSPGSFAGSAAALALEADASVDVAAVRAAAGADDLSPQDPLPAADIATFHRTAPAIPPAMPALYLDPPQAVAAGGLSPAAEAPLSPRRIDRTQDSHPLLEGVSLLDLPVVLAARELDPRCTALASAGDRTAIAACDPAPASGPRSLTIAFDLDHSSLAQRPDLAALFQNAATWLTETPARSDLITDTGLRNAINLQADWATRINDSTLDPVPTDRLSDLDRSNRRPWSWRTLALAGLLFASFEAITFFRGLTL